MANLCLLTWTMGMVTVTSTLMVSILVVVLVMEVWGAEDVVGSAALELVAASVAVLELVAGSSGDEETPGSLDDEVAVGSATFVIVAGSTGAAGSVMAGNMPADTADGVTYTVAVLLRSQ